MAVNGSNLALGDRVEFDLPISGRWCKIGYIKIVQLTPGDMDVRFEIWESSPVTEGVRSELYKNVVRRTITLDEIQGAQYGESLLGNLIPYKDRDAGRTYMLHCVLINEMEGTPSDFAVSVKVADIGEVM